MAYDLQHTTYCRMSLIRLCDWLMTVLKMVLNIRTDYEYRPNSPKSF